MAYLIYREALNRASCQYAFSRPVRIGKTHATLAEALEQALALAKKNHSKVRIVSNAKPFNSATPNIEVWPTGYTHFSPGFLADLIEEIHADRAKGAQAMECLAAM